MNKKTVAVLASLLAIGGITVAVTALQPSLTDALHEHLGSSGDDATDEHASQGADASDSQGDAQDEAPGSSSPEASTLNPQDDPPLVNAPMRGASPMQMTEDLLGPTPEDLRTVDPEMTLAEALRQHPSFPSDEPIETPGIPTEGPLENALARLLQAHGIMTELQTAASEGDPVAKDLLPHAAAQLAEEADRSAPTFNAASDLYTLGEDAQLRLNGQPVPVEHVASYQQEVDRLYSLIGLPQTAADPGAHDPTELARLVHATADVVEATKEAQQAAQRADEIQDDLERVDAALQDGALTEEDAQLLVTVARTVHEVTLEPIQQRLDALDTLYATTEALAPSLTTTAGSTPIQDAGMPMDEHELATVEELLGMIGGDGDETVNNVQDGLEEGVQGLEELANQTEEGVEEITRGGEETYNETEEQVEETIQPVNDQLAENFVDPFGAIMILGDGNDHVNGTGAPVPVNVPGVGAVGSLFPRAPLLVVDQGGEETYEQIPRSTAADETVQGTGEPLVPEDEIREGTPVDPREPMPPLGGLFEPVELFVNALASVVYDSATAPVEDQQGVEVAVTADTPIQVVVDLDGDDAYTGEIGAAYAAGGGTAAVYDAAGNDTYDVGKGIGLIEEDGLAIVKDYAGNDTIRAERGVGSVLEPFTVGEFDRAEFEDDFRYRVGGLGGFVNFAGDNMYEVEEAGIGLAFGRSLNFDSQMGGLVPVVAPVALDLAGGAEDFAPTLLGDTFDPTNEVERDDGGALAAWAEEQDGFRYAFTPDSLGNPMVRLQAAYRTYEADLAEPSEGTIHVQDHNVTLGIPSSSMIELPSSSMTLQNEILIHLDDEPREYEPDYPLILIDAGDTNDVYRNATPPGMIANATDAPQSAGQLATVGQGIFGDDVTVAPNLVLDTRGNDRYEGQTAHLNTSRLAQELRSENEDSEGLRAPVAGTVVADLGGDDAFDGDVASVDVNMTLYSSTMTSLVYSAGGSDTITGGHVGGITVSHAMDAETFLDSQVGHSVTSLLLMGTQDPETERNRIEAAEGSMGSILVQEPGEEEEAIVQPNTKLTAASIVAGPSDFISTEHSFGSVRWCDAGERCPDSEGGSDVSVDLISDSERPELRALFVGGNTPNTYTLDSPDAIGHVTIDPEADLCTSQEVSLGDPPSRVSETPPSILTRFVETGGPTVYEMTDRTEESPAWRNDHSWRPFGEDEDEQCPETQLGHPAVMDALGQDYVRPSETPAGDVATVQTIDTLAIDNLGQFVLGTAGEATGGQIEEQTGLTFEPPRLCAAPFAVAEDGSTLRGFNQPTHRCADASDPRTLSEDALQAHERMLITTETRGTVPANAFAALNPCDTGNTGDRFLDLDALEENVPGGNPLAQGTSGCWATLEVKKQTSSSTTSPTWSPLAPNGEGWLPVMASPLYCGYTDDDGMPVKCATDAAPVPYTVDGSDGYNLERWFLAEGDYDYRVTLNGPISTLMGEETMFEGQLTLDREPLKQAQPVPGYEVPVETQEKPGLLTWLEDASPDEIPGALEGFDVRVVHQDEQGPPEHVEVWSPLILPSYRDIVPGVCLDGTPYRGIASDASTGWRGDRGHWVTTYPLDAWDADEAPQDCQDATPSAALDAKHEPLPVDTGLWHAPFGDEPRRLQLPEDATTETVLVDETEPELTLTPLPGPDGEPLKQLDADATGTVGIGIQDLSAPQISGNMDEDDLTDGPLYIQLPLNVTSHSPMQQIRFAGVTDDPLQENVIESHEDEGQIMQGIQITYDHDDHAGTLPCSPSDSQDHVACQARLNLTRAGQAPDGTWYRHAHLNLTLHTSDEAGTDQAELRDALERSIRDDEDITFEVVQDGDVEVEDEAGNQLSKDLDEIVLNLYRPSDLAVPCEGDGLEVVTREGTVTVRTYTEDEDTLLGLLVEARQGDEWTVQDWIWMDELDPVDGDCTPDADGDWLGFDYAVQHAAPNETVRQELRTVPVDEVGNRALSFGPFEFAVIADQQAPTLRLDQHAATPSSVTVNVTADEPVALDTDLALQAPDGDAHKPLSVSEERDRHHQLVFPALDVNTTYELPVDAVDEAGNAANANTHVETARTLDVSLETRPDVVGDAVEIAFTAGALAPDQQGAPMTRIQATATTQDQECASPRSTTQYIDAPIDDPRTYTVTLPLTECPGGELTLELHLENGPEDEPIESLTLTTDTIRDTETPTPRIDVQGEKAATGWYTSPVSITPTGEDDTGIQHARLETRDGPVSQRMIDQPGVHEVTVTAVDHANRTATRTLDVPIDLAPPEVHLVSQDPLPTERSTITVEAAGADDASGLDSIRTLDADGSFTDWSPVVEGMQLRLDIQGLDEIVAEVRDRAGHVTQTVLPVTSLANPPTVEDGGLVAVSPSTIEVHAELDRPLELDALAEQDGTLVSKTTSPQADEHRFTLEGLRPATETLVTVRAQLTDGSAVTLEEVSGTVQLPASQGPPTVPENLSAEVLSDGTVTVSWDAARDDAGIDRYLVERSTGGQLSDQRSVTDTKILDDPAPGATHEYRVQAVDLAGRSGGWTMPVAVTPQAPLEVVSYEITPQIAPAGTPVEITVVAEGDGAPGTAAVTFGDERIPLALEEGEDGRWVYSANVDLPATDTFFPEGITVHLDDATFPEEGSYPGPVVKALEDEQIATTEDVPAPSLAVLLTVLTLIPLARRWTA